MNISHSTTDQQRFSCYWGIARLVRPLDDLILHVVQTEPRLLLVVMVADGGPDYVLTQKCEETI